MTDKHRVLIVEDEVITASSIKMGLEFAGHEVCPLATRSGKAIEIALDKKPDVILMDVNLPGGMNGIDTAREILKHIKTQVIFLTGYHDDTISTQINSLNPLGYIVKPVSVDRIKQMLEKNL